jgi:hypothetical protein
MRKITTGFKPIPLKNAILTRDHVYALKSQVNLEKHAHDVARKIIKKANLDAAEIQRHATQIGLEVGFAHVIDVIADMITSQKAFESTMYNALMEKISTNLTQLLSDDDIFLSVIRKWHLTCGLPESSGAVEILLPRSRKLNVKYIIEKVEEIKGVPVTVNYHENTYYVIKHNDQLMKFDADEFVSSTCDSGLWRSCLAPTKINEIYEHFILSLQKKCNINASTLEVL